MTQEPRDAHGARPLPDDDDDRALNEALNDLERILDKKSAAAGAAPATDFTDPGDDDPGKAPGGPVIDSPSDTGTEDSAFARLDDLIGKAERAPPVQADWTTSTPPHDRFDSSLRSDTVTGQGGERGLSITPGKSDAGVATDPCGDPYTGSPYTAPDEPRIWSDALTEQVATRLASEIEVITQACLERSLERVAAEVRDRIRAHIAIVLPEILEEMARKALEDDPGDVAD